MRSATLIATLLLSTAFVTLAAPTAEAHIFLCPATDPECIVECIMEHTPEELLPPSHCRVIV